MKCQALQRRLVRALEAAANKDARIAELERLREELKALLARQPGAESALLISDLQVRGHCPPCWDACWTGTHEMPA